MRSRKEDRCMSERTREAWLNIEQKLREIIPEHMYKNTLDLLRPPVFEEALSDVEKFTKIALPNNLKTLLSIHDGWSDIGYFHFILPHWKKDEASWTLLSAEYIASEFEVNIGVREDTGQDDFWHDDWLPVFADCNGNFVALDSKDGRILFVDTDMNPRIVLADSLEELLEQQARIFLDGGYRWNEDSLVRAPT